MDREKLDQWCEWCIFGLVMALLAFAPIAMGAVRPLEFLIVQGLTLMILAVWVVRLWVNPKYRLLWPPISWAVLGFLGYTIARYQYAEVEILARQELIRVVIYTVVFFAIVNHVNRQGLALALCIGLIVVASLDSVYAIFQFARHSRSIFEFLRPASYGTRVGGTFVNPNHLAGFLGMILPLTVALVVAGKLSHAYRIVLAYLGGLMLVGVALTVSRGGYGAVGASLLALLLILVRRRQYRITAAILLVVAAGAGWYLLHSENLMEARERAVAQSHGWDIRPVIWKAALEMWKDHPWFGVGPGHFDLRFCQYRPSDAQAHPDFAHNDYLQTLSEWGLTGFLLVLAAFGIALVGLIKTWPRVQRVESGLHTKKSNKPAIVLGASMGLLAMLLHAMTEFNMQIPANALLAVALLGILSAYLRFATDGYWVTLQVAGKIVATLVLTGAAVYLGSQLVRRATVYRLVEQGKKQQDRPAALKLWAAALEVDPLDEAVCSMIADAYRVQALDGLNGWEEAARKGLVYYNHGMDINPLDAYNYTGYGQCLDWLGQNRRSTPFFDHALVLDPNNANIINLRGWHEMQSGDFVQARRWFGRSLVVKRWYNHLAETYYAMMSRRIAEAQVKGK